MKTATTIPKGSIFTISTGCYSDYMVEGVFRALADIEPDKLLKDYLERHPEQNERYKFIEKTYIASVSHLCEPIHSYEWHISDYGDPEEQWLQETE